jgi:hypothetical protein
VRDLVHTSITNMVFDQRAFRAFRAFSWKLLTDFTAKDMMCEYLVLQPCSQQASGWILWPLHYCVLRIVHKVSYALFFCICKWFS